MEKRLSTEELTKRSTQRALTRFKQSGKAEDSPRMKEFEKKLNQLTTK